MCGIFGIIAKEEIYSKIILTPILEDLARYSQVRGKDSSGMAFKNNNKKSYDIIKGPVSVNKLLSTQEYKKIKYAFVKEINNKKKLSYAVLGHARLVTNGTQLEDKNNQPIIKDGIIGIHNGIIVNVDTLWENFSDLHRENEIDTEVAFSIFSKYLKESNNPINAIEKTNIMIEGTMSIAVFINGREEFLLFTNNGSLYILTNDEDLFVYGSEEFILRQLKNKHNTIFNSKFRIRQVLPNSGYLIRYTDFNIIEFRSSDNNSYISEKTEDFDVNVQNYRPKSKQPNAVINPGKYISDLRFADDRKILEYNVGEISKLKRCTKCLLPSTFPFIKYDKGGVCNYCRNYVKKNRKNTLEELENIIKPYRSVRGENECIVPFSGGRDSTFSLHMLKKELNLNVITYTYDWGMVTDLARRNIARVCGRLGVENIIVSANIQKKRYYIKKNLTAWLKKPDLGMVPILMSGDKSFHYYLKKLQKQTGINLNIWGENYLENTDFKVGFAGVPPIFNKEVLYKLSRNNQLLLLKYLIKQYLTNPLYINSSLYDNIRSHYSRSFMKKNDNYNFFQYYAWDENEVESTILNEYNWEKAIDTDSTWRIGDGTAGFYNYIYYTVAGFSEYDTFRSNQIREGMISREKAFELINKENIPRYESIKWYLEIIGLNYKDVIQKINNIPKLYINTNK